MTPGGRPPPTDTDAEDADADAELIRSIRAGLRERADPVRAPQMQAYMKSAMPFRGVRLPEVRAVVQEAARQRPPVTPAAVVADVRELWDHARYREERYAATALADTAPARRLRTADLITLHRHLIVDGAWWDHVDEVSHRVGELLRAFPADVGPVVCGWQRADDRWLRRASIICQVGAREHTDTAMLTDAIVASSDEPDFFLRKAIGWALRDYARTDAAWVRRFVAEHPLSPLSVREALKHVGAD